MKKANTKWVDELNSIPLSLRTTPNRSTGYTPFFMVYGAEAILPSDLIQNTTRLRQYEEQEAKQDRQGNLDTLDEERDMATA